jgi:hypothetical protein
VFKDDEEDDDDSGGGGGVGGSGSGGRSRVSCNCPPHMVHEDGTCVETTHAQRPLYEGVPIINVNDIESSSGNNNSNNNNRSSNSKERRNRRGNMTIHDPCSFDILTGKPIDGRTVIDTKPIDANERQKNAVRCEFNEAGIIPLRRKYSVYSNKYTVISDSAIRLSNDIKYLSFGRNPKDYSVFVEYKGPLNQVNEVIVKSYSVRRLTEYGATDVSFRVELSAEIDSSTNLIASLKRFGTYSSADGHWHFTAHSPDGLDQKTDV